MKNKVDRITVGLVKDIYDIFRVNNRSKMPTKELLNHLNVSTDTRWTKYSDSNKLSARRLSSLLKDVNIHSQDFRFKEKVFKGYRRRWFVEAKRNIKAQQSDRTQHVIY